MPMSITIVFVHPPPPRNAELVVSCAIIHHLSSLTVTDCYPRETERETELLRETEMLAPHTSMPRLAATQPNQCHPGDP